MDRIIPQIIVIIIILSFEICKIRVYPNLPGANRLLHGGRTQTILVKQ
jgi:hypothetical protein